MTNDELQKLPIKELAEYVFEDKQVAAEWLVTRNVALSNQSPLRIMQSDSGEAVVHNLLMRIVYGVLA